MPAWLCEGCAFARHGPSVIRDFLRGPNSVCSRIDIASGQVYGSGVNRDLEMMRKRTSLRVGWLLAVAIGSATEVEAQLQPAAGALGEVCQYTLLPDSRLTDDCPVCARPTFEVPIRGTFQLRFVGEDLLFRTYALEQISFIGGTPGINGYGVTGTGTYRVGGEVAQVQEMTLQVRIDRDQTPFVCFFTNVNSTVPRLWPMLGITLAQTNGTPVQQFGLTLMAAPFHEIWFSTTHSLTAGIWTWPTNVVTDGDLLSSAGRIVRRDPALVGALGFMPVVPDLGLDALELRPGGEILFSTTTDWFSEKLGRTVHGGDVLSDHGTVIADFATLLSAFSPQPPVADEGLDALHVTADGEILFSVTNDFFSERLGRMIRRGDLLSARGVVVKSNEELLARFNPADGSKDLGLDAIFVWPSGEIWFSVETGFYGQHFESYLAGDLLSDQGYVVYRNLDLVGPFQPLEDLADFGLDALTIISDAVSVPAVPPRCRSVSLDQSKGQLRLEWDAPGRVAQLEMATNVTGPYLPVGAIDTVGCFTNTTIPATNPAAYLRLKQW